jgi:hypothetical protein
MRKALVLTIAAAALAGGLAAPALAAGPVCNPANGDVCSGVTQVAFAVLPNVGTLSIVPTPATAGAGGVAGNPIASTGLDTAKTVTVPLGVTTVLDTRTASTGWTMSASASNFAQAAPATATISKNFAKFSVPVAPALPTTGLTGLTGIAVPTFTGYNAGAAPASDGSGNATLLTATATGINAAAFIPVLTVDVTGATAGVYTGTVTQSVS